ncbi:helix-turn-helix domain-containing protein [uncultured Tateyamaria sp.]|uniref:helix-turn-helix domain-containing protein n=1 Tax=Tateyamaria sp. 1078 TaxID=3417464 RepID=UPI002625FC30|nr:helix-turn-helix domain-containing protein [uncultured Tateyamaria sp.]
MTPDELASQLSFERANLLADLAVIIDATGLTKTPAALLRRLLQSCGHTVDRDALNASLDEVRGSDCEGVEALRKAMARCRDSAKVMGWTITPVRGVGYRLERE